MIGAKSKKCPYCKFLFPVDEEPEKKKQIEKAEKKACGRIIDFDPNKLIHSVECDVITSTFVRSKGKELVKMTFVSGNRQICKKWVSPVPVKSRDIRKRYPKKKADELWESMGGDGNTAAPNSVREWIQRQRTRGSWVIEIDFSGKYPEFKRIRRKSEKRDSDTERMSQTA